MVGFAELMFIFFLGLWVPMVNGGGASYFPSFSCFRMVTLKFFLSLGYAGFGSFGAISDFSSA